MSSDLIVSLGVIGLFAAILHLKSHLKFIMLGAFVGLVLDQVVAGPVNDYLIRHFNSLNRPYTHNILELFLLLLPTLILGINHAADKKRQNLGQMIVYTSVTTLLLAASILRYLPDNARIFVTSHSTLAFELTQFQTWLVGLGALVLIAESFYHRKVSKKSKKV